MAFSFSFAPPPDRMKEANGVPSGGILGVFRPTFSGRKKVSASYGVGPVSVDVRGLKNSFAVVVEIVRGGGANAGDQVIRPGAEEIASLWLSKSFRGYLDCDSPAGLKKRSRATPSRFRRPLAERPGPRHSPPLPSRFRRPLTSTLTAPTPQSAPMGGKPPEFPLRSRH